MVQYPINITPPYQEDNQPRLRTKEKKLAENTLGKKFTNFTNIGQVGTSILLLSTETEQVRMEPGYGESMPNIYGMRQYRATFSNGIKTDFFGPEDAEVKNAICRGVCSIAVLLC